MFEVFVVVVCKWVVFVLVFCFDWEENVVSDIVLFDKCWWVDLVVIIVLVGDVGRVVEGLFEGGWDLGKVGCVGELFDF